MQLLYSRAHGSFNADARRTSLASGQQHKHTLREIGFYNEEVLWGDSHWIILSDCLVLHLVSKTSVSLLLPNNFPAEITGYDT